MNGLNEEQIKLLQTQCGYVPFLMNRSKAARDYLKGMVLKFVVFVALCALVKWNGVFLAVLVPYAIYVLIDSYVKAFAIMRKHMINHLDKAVVLGFGVVQDKRHRYATGLIRLFSRRSGEDSGDNPYRVHYFSELKVLVPENEAIWLPCTNQTFEQAAAGDPAILLEFPEAYELGKRCCFLNQ